MWCCHHTFVEGSLYFSAIKKIDEAFSVIDSSVKYILGTSVSDRVFHFFFFCNLFIELVYTNTDFRPFFIIVGYFILALLIGLAEREYPGLVVRTGELAVNIFLIKDLKVADVGAFKHAVPVFISLPVIEITGYR